MQNVYSAALPPARDGESQFLVCLRTLLSLRTTIGSQLKIPMANQLPIANVQDTWWVVTDFRTKQIVEWRYVSSDTSTTFVVRGEDSLVVIGDSAHVYNMECASAIAKVNTPESLPNNHIVGLERVYPLTAFNEFLRCISEIPSEQGERLHQKLDRLNKLGYKLVLLQNGKVMLRAPKPEGN